MGRIYTVAGTFTYANSTGNMDFLEILPADDKPCKLRGFTISQISEVGDAAEEGIDVTVKRLDATVTSGSGGSSATGRPMDSADAAAGFAAEIGNGTVATTSGSGPFLLGEVGWNVRMPLDIWYPDDRFCPKVKQGEALVIRGESTPADDITLCITAWIEEE